MSHILVTSQMATIIIDNIICIFYQNINKHVTEITK